MDAALAVVATPRSIWALMILSVAVSTDFDAVATGKDADATDSSGGELPICLWRIRSATSLSLIAQLKTCEQLRSVFL